MNLLYLGVIQIKDFTYSTPSHERKKYVYYTKRWEGVDWRGVPVNPVNGHIQGLYTKHFTKLIYGQKGEYPSYEYVINMVLAQAEKFESEAGAKYWISPTQIHPHRISYIK